MRTARPQSIHRSKAIFKYANKMFNAQSYAVKWHMAGMYDLIHVARLRLCGDYALAKIMLQNIKREREHAIEQYGKFLP